MALTITTWNINSVRLRLEQVLRLLAETQPDVLCLQETKCPDDKFPLKAFRDAGYEHIALHGQKGYHGVAVMARLPFADVTRTPFADRGDARHVAVKLTEGAHAGVTIHNFYVPAGGDEPDPAINPKFQHKLDFLDHMTSWGEKLAPKRAILVGDLNIAPLPNDVWSHEKLLSVVSHTPVEVERLGRVAAAGGWVDAVRRHLPETEKLFTWWSYRAQDWLASNRGRRLDHVWVSADMAESAGGYSVLQATRGWERPSDHVPVTVTLEG